ncbi:hypothetical protein DQ354_13700 [Arthrobacter sp. AQ5-06]|nr:hypothetical protein DQ354_13700 [Arthrobacter sp. AQ5-06]
MKRLPGDKATGPVLVRADSAFHGYATVNAAAKAGAAVSVTARMDPAIRKAIAGIGEAAWKPIQYTHALFDETADRWISSAEVAETGYTAFSSRKQGEPVTGRLVVRRIPDLNPHAGGRTADDLRHLPVHAFFTPGTLDAVAADKAHRGHAIFE